MSLGGARKTLATAWWFRVALEGQQDHRVLGWLEEWGLRLPVSLTDGAAAARPPAAVVRGPSKASKSSRQRPGAQRSTRR